MVVLDKLCGAAYREAFIGFTDLFQKVIDAFIPDFWPFGSIQYCFDQAFNALQEQLKPFAYDIGANMGANMEAQITAWLENQKAAIKAQIQAEADKQLQKLRALEERVQALETQIGHTRIPLIGGLLSR